MCGTTLQSIVQALEQILISVEGSRDVLGQYIQCSKFTRGYFALLWIPAGQEVLVEGDTICKVLWIPVIIQETGAFHMGHKATCSCAAQAEAQQQRQENGHALVDTGDSGTRTSSYRALGPFLLLKPQSG